MTDTTRVLTVDDSASMRALLNHALSTNGFDVVQAEDGIEALEWLASNEADVVITDINMPRLDGFGLIERLRGGSRHRDRPILVLTTESSDEKKARARQAGATGWIVKPFDTEKLIAAVRRVSH
ncbi:response regulator [Novosphingobium sp. PS1R-30]|uniref:Response regulator n=1 Tax=Novosphingobium anseongense TaxID=3133436 RepID=A0ABU8RPX5_9SPHN|nr:response regulator [Novosphingobium sp. JCM 18896]MCW1427547.1 response regulator [Novosphingobium sp. JCM 18896]RZK03462.1 MAG: response regulator [Novosphingobium sp.]